MRITRHGSVCTQSLGPRESSSRWSVVPRSTASPRWIVGPFCLSGRWVMRALPVSQARSLSSHETICAIGTCSSCLWANIGSPGPKFTAGMPSAVNRATSVQPNFGFGSPPTAATNAAAAGTESPGSAPGAESVSSSS